uniref:jacalin-related lectin 2-like n=1 Tax=Erigeron canadensis TaxID=72917 RepID=UPI001CB8F55A|nr:jacalin-related lectin 2-like [Erigeron canadensis]
MLKLGPKNKSELGTAWDEYGNSNVVQILISHQGNTIKSLQFVYAADNGCLRYSQTYGQPDGLNFNIVTFKHPSEYLTSVSGTYTLQRKTENNKIKTTAGLTSLTFGTNKAKYGPFGGGGGTTSTTTCNCTFNYDFGHRSCFLGFHGALNKQSQVSAIGVYVKPTGSLDELKDDEAVRVSSTKKKVPNYFI